VGARFRGHNRQGWRRWSTTPTIVVADPGREFAFETADTRWTYRLDPVDGGTDVTESWDTIKQRGVALRLLMRLFEGSDRAGEMQRGMEQTLLRVKAAAETE
jgi:hypothetical protein